MGLNIVEAFVVAASASYLMAREFDQFEPTREEAAAVTVLSQGMDRSGFRWRPGLLASPFGDTYSAGVAGLIWLKVRTRERAA